MKPLVRALAAFSTGIAILGAFAAAILYTAAAAPEDSAAKAHDAPAPAKPQPAPGDLRREVAGWTVEDVADPQTGDPEHRTIRMSREVEGGSVELLLEAGARNDEPWQLSYMVNLSAIDGFCSSGAGTRLAGDDLGERTQSARAAALGQFAEAADQCGQPVNASGAALAGFDDAFAVLAGWYERRRAGAEPAGAPKPSPRAMRERAGTGFSQ